MSCVHIVFNDIPTRVFPSHVRSTVTFKLFQPVSIVGAVMMPLQPPMMKIFLSRTFESRSMSNCAIMSCRNILKEYLFWKNNVNVCKFFVKFVYIPILSWIFLKNMNHDLLAQFTHFGRLCSMFRCALHSSTTTATTPETPGLQLVRSAAWDWNPWKR